MLRLSWCSRDSSLIFLSRVTRAYSFGGLAVTLLLYLSALGLSPAAVAALLSAILVGDLLLSLPLATRADAWGRRRTLLASAALKAAAGVAFAAVDAAAAESGVAVAVLVVAGTVGVVSPAGGEVGPFVPVEQAALTAVVKAEKHMETVFADVFAWYQLGGSVAQAAGAVGTGVMVKVLVQEGKWSELAAYRVVMVQYAVLSGLMMAFYALLSDKVEAAPKPSESEPVVKEAEMVPLKAASDVDAEASSATSTTTTTPPPPPAQEQQQQQPSLMLRLTGLKRESSLNTVSKLTASFIVDAFAGGLVMQSLMVNYFHFRFGLDTGVLGGMLAGINLLAGASALAVGTLVARWGAIRTMVYTHLPSNVMLALVPAMPTAETAIGMLLLRSTLSQMDVPARQAFVAASVQDDERSAAGGITNVARSVGVALAPALWGPLIAAPADSLAFAAPFIIAGVLKCVYDLVVFALFRSSPTAAPATG